MPITQAPETKWRLTSEGLLPIRCWDGDYVVYNRLSGDTHILDIVTGEVLRKIMAAPALGKEVSGHVARFLEVPDDTNVATRVDAILAALDRLGLIEPAVGC